MSQVYVGNMFESSGGPIVTINGDTGSITGTTVTIYAHNSTVNAGSSVLFVNSGTVSTFNVSDASLNTMIGSNAGNLTMAGAANTGLGVNAGKSLTSGSENTLIGAGTGENLNTGGNNTCVGFLAGSLLNTGTESSNIIIGHLGVNGDDNTTRIGTTGTQNLCYIAGINGATPVNVNVPLVTLCDDVGNLTTITSSTSGFILTSNGTNAPSFQAPAASPTITGTATTTGNTTAVINVNLPLSTSNSCMSVRANIAGYDRTANLMTGGELIGSVRNVGGVLTVVNVDVTENDDAAIHDTTWTLVTSGTNVQVRVTGTANGGGVDVIGWTAIIDYVISS